MDYIKLKRMGKEQLIEYLIPLIEKAVKINEYWASEKDVHGCPIPDENDPSAFWDKDAQEASGDIWAALRDLHDDYGDEP